MTYFEISAQVIYVIFKNSWDEVATCNPSIAPGSACGYIIYVIASSWSEILFINMLEELIEDRYKFLKGMSMGNTGSQITKNVKDFHLMYVRIGKRKGRGSG